MTIKIFIGNLSSDTTADEVRALFEKYGTVAECDVLKNFGFVHMTDKSSADSAIADLDGYSIHGQKMRVELSTGKKGNPKGDRRGPGGPGGRPRPYPPGPPRDRMPPPPGYDRYDPYYRPPYPERDPYMRPLPPVDRYLPPRTPLGGDRYAPLPPRDALLPEERRPYPPDPRDRLMPPRERMPLYPEDRAATYDRLRAAERAPMASDPYYRERSPPLARPPPEYYDRKPLSAGRDPQAAGSSAGGRMNSTAYPPSNGYDFYRQPAERSDYRAAAQASDYYAAPRGGGAGGGLYDRNGGAGSFDRPGAGGAGAYGRNMAASQGPAGGGYGMQQSKGYDTQQQLQSKPIFF